jgi:hypothetical protein
LEAVVINTIVTLVPDYPVLPDHIDAGVHFFDAFHHNETEVSAGYIVRFCQQRGQGWAPFSQADIEAFYNRSGHTDFRFNRLLPGLIHQDLHGLFHVTHEFVAACFKASLRRTPAQVTSTP